MRHHQDGALGLGLGLGLGSGSGSRSGAHQRAAGAIAGRDGNESSTRSVASTAATVVYRAIEPNSSTTRWTSCGRCEKRQGRVASTGVPGVSNGRPGSRWRHGMDGPSARLTTLSEHRVRPGVELHASTRGGPNDQRLHCCQKTTYTYQPAVCRRWRR